MLQWPNCMYRRRCGRLRQSVLHDLGASNGECHSNCLPHALRRADCCWHRQIRDVMLRFRVLLDAPTRLASTPPRSSANNSEPFATNATRRTIARIVWANARTIIVALRWYSHATSTLHPNRPAMRHLTNRL
jgi:hypothetical protein